MRYLQINIEFNEDVYKLSETLINELQALKDNGADLTVTPNGFDPANWTTPDIEDKYFDLYGTYPTEYQVDHIINTLEKEFDAGHGINWDVLDSASIQDFDLD